MELLYRDEVFQIKRNLFLAGGMILIILISAGIYTLYGSFHPDIQISHGGGGKGEGYSFEPVTISYSHSVPIAKSIKEKMMQLLDENEKIVNDLYNNYIAPTHVRSYGEVKDGKTIIRYTNIQLKTL